MKIAQLNQQNGIVHHNSRKNYVNVGLLKCGCGVTASWCL